MRDKAQVTINLPAFVILQSDEMQLQLRLCPKPHWSCFYNAPPESRSPGVDGNGKKKTKDGKERKGEGKQKQGKRKREEG